VKAVIQEALLAFNPGRESVSVALAFIVSFGVIGFTGDKVTCVVSEDDFNTWERSILSWLRRSV
jgi:hypothetical protein